MRPTSRKLHLLSRRETLGLVLTGGGGLLLSDAATAPSAWAAQPAPAAPAAPPPPTLLNRFPRMVHEYFVDRVCEVERAADEVRAKLQTKADAENYVRTVREKILASFGGFPEKTPLNPRITGVLDRDAYRIEKVIFTSRPDFLVTANLYVPKGRKLPLPGVVANCGHSSNGKAYETYQSFAQALARIGYVVLIFDPIGQGERTQYLELNTPPGHGRGTGEHFRAGVQQVLVGESLAAWMAWDGIRALDYLLSREEVDPRHVGVTGNSGGGTLTTWLCGLDPRWTMAAPSCFVTTFRRNMENEQSADPEQFPSKALALGLDHSDMLAALAPKPLLILAKEKDYFDVRGTAETYARLKRLYSLLGAEKNVGFFVGEGHHGFSQDNREAMYRWFNRAAGVSWDGGEPALVVEKDEDLWCTPNGRVAELKSRPVFSYINQAARQLAEKRRPLPQDELLRTVVEVLKLPDRRGEPDYRILRPLAERGYPKKHCMTYAVRTEPGIHALVHLLLDEVHYSRPPQGVPRAVLYVAHQSSDAELRGEPLVAEVIRAEPESALYACDVRGIGDSRADTCGVGQFWGERGADYFYAFFSLMLDSPYVGQKTLDVLRVLDWLAAQGHRQVHLVGKGWGALPATFAALLSPLVVQVTLNSALTSYGELAAQAETRPWPLSTLVPGVLQHFDLPDCYRALAVKNLRQLEPWEPKTGG